MSPNPEDRLGPVSIAPVWHTCVLLAMLGGFSLLSVYLKMGSNSARLDNLLLYFIAIAFEWIVFAFVLSYSDPAMTDYVGRVFRDRRSLLVDVAAALLLVAFSFLVGPLVVRVLGSTGWVSLEGMRPHNGIQIAFWIVTAVSAGISEETVFRGYLQRQFTGWSGRSAAGILGQAAVFGLIHGYQGWKNMVLVFVLGSIFGAFALLRKGIRANVIAHAAVDILAAF
jgi:uncharacterized protein